MYRKIVVPLDGSDEAERVLPIVKNVLSPGGQVILLRIVTPMQLMGAGAGEIPVYSEKLEEAERQSSLDYLRSVRQRLGDAAGQWQCAVVLSGAIADTIAEFASKQEADLIAMYTHDRKGLAKLIRGSVAERVQRKASIEVQIFKPWELEEYAAANASSEESERSTWVTSMLNEVGPFNGLSEEHLNMVAALADTRQVAAGDILGEAGSQGDALYIVVHGEAQLSTHSSMGEITVRVAGPRESFPVSVLIGPGTLITSAKALTNMALLVLPRSKLADLFSENPDLGFRVYMNICDLVASRYRRTLEHLVLSEESVVQDADSLMAH